MCESECFRQISVISASPLGNGSITPIATHHSNHSKSEDGREWVSFASVVARSGTSANISSKWRDVVFVMVHLKICGCIMRCILSGMA